MEGEVLHSTSSKVFQANVNNSVIEVPSKDNQIPVFASPFIFYSKTVNRYFYRG